MNRLEGLVLSCSGASGICSVDVSCAAGTVVSLVFGSPGSAPWLRAGTPIAAAFKESDVLLAGRGRFPWPGALHARVVRLSPGDVLSRIDLDASGAPVSALVPGSRVLALGIEEGTEVDFWVPPHEVVLEEVGE